MIDLHGIDVRAERGQRSSDCSLLLHREVPVCVALCRYLFQKSLPGLGRAGKCLVEAQCHL